MYLYFDKNGVLKEVINNDALRQTDMTNKIYIYVEDTEVESVTLKYRIPSGGLPLVYGSTTPVVDKVPYNPKQDLKFFKYNVDYPFIEIPTSFTVENVQYSALAEAGTVTLTVRINDKPLGLIVFNVEASSEGNDIAYDEYISLAQFYYLLGIYERLVTDTEFVTVQTSQHVTGSKLLDYLKAILNNFKLVVSDSETADRFSFAYEQNSELKKTLKILAEVYNGVSFGTNFAWQFPFKSGTLATTDDLPTAGMEKISKSSTSDAFTNDEINLLVQGKAFLQYHPVPDFYFYFVSKIDSTYLYMTQLIDGTDISFARIKLSDGTWSIVHKDINELALYTLSENQRIDEMPESFCAFKMATGHQLYSYSSDGTVFTITDLLNGDVWSGNVADATILRDIIGNINFLKSCDLKPISFHGGYTLTSGDVAKLATGKYYISYPYGGTSNRRYYLVDSSSTELVFACSYGYTIYTITIDRDNVTWTSSTGSGLKEITKSSTSDLFTSSEIEALESQRAYFNFTISSFMCFFRATERILSSNSLVLEMTNGATRKYRVTINRSDGTWTYETRYNKCIEKIDNYGNIDLINGVSSGSLTGDYVGMFHYTDSNSTFSGRYLIAKYRSGYDEYTFTIFDLSRGYSYQGIVTSLLTFGDVISGPTSSYYTTSIIGGNTPGLPRMIIDYSTTIKQVRDQFGDYNTGILQYTNSTTGDTKVFLANVFFIGGNSYGISFIYDIKENGIYKGDNIAATLSILTHICTGSNSSYYQSNTLPIVESESSTQLQYLPLGKPFILHYYNSGQTGTTSEYFIGQQNAVGNHRNYFFIRLSDGAIIKPTDVNDISPTTTVVTALYTTSYRHQVRHYLHTITIKVGTSSVPGSVTMYFTYMNNVSTGSVSSTGFTYVSSKKITFSGMLASTAQQMHFAGYNGVSDYHPAPMVSLFEGGSGKGAIYLDSNDTLQFSSSFTDADVTETVTPY